MIEEENNNNTINYQLLWSRHSKGWLTKTNIWETVEDSRFGGRVPTTYTDLIKKVINSHFSNT